MKYIVTLNGKDYEVEVEKGEATLLSVNSAQVATAAPAAAPAAVPAAAPAPAPEAPAAAPAPAAVSAEGEAIKAPMPGAIINVPVTEGAAVKKGQVIMILEAMKMENEIVSPKDGVVKQLVVSKGSKVSTGDALFVIG